MSGTNSTNKSSGRVKMKSSHRHHKKDPAGSDSESTTPPLPHGFLSSIDELITQKECLQNELRHLENHSDVELNSSKIVSKYHCKHSIPSDFEILQSRKRCNSDKRGVNIKKKNLAQGLATANAVDNADIESEDEESIIKKRRQNRIQLLAKLCNTNNVEKRTVNNTNVDNKQNQASDSCLSKVIVKAKEATDMFSENDDSFGKIESKTLNSSLPEDCAHADGYCNVRPGEEIEKGRYLIKSVLGQGVFANVVKAQDNSKGNDEVAIKIIRNNSLMYKTGLKEIDILKKITHTDLNNRNHCVKYYRHFMHKGHLCLVLETLCMDLRTVLKRYGKRQGINMTALISYTRQMFTALKFLKKIGIVHADIKPDNILVNEKKNLLKLCDFGSAYLADHYEATPYIVSRFYRAPEIILGIPYRFSVDLWSAACTIYEMATGNIMFTGDSNNKMLKYFMDLKGKFSMKVIRKGKFKDQHFNYKNNFLLHKKDEFTEREKVVEIANITVTRDLHKEFRKLYSDQWFSVDLKKKVLQMQDLLDKMLMIDMNQRISIIDCLKHPFVKEE